MGQETFAKSPDEAMDILTDREFPEILKVQEGASHDVKFIPASFIYVHLTEKVMFNCQYYHKISKIKYSQKLKQSLQVTWKISFPLIT
jgi:hypothetical protein